MKLDPALYPVDSISLDELNQLRAEADGQGRVQHYPGLVDGVAIDREVVAEIPCEVCQGKMEYVGIHNRGSYRAFAVCQACAYAQEF